MPDTMPHRSHVKRIVLWVLGVAVVLFGISAITVWILAAKYAEPFLRAQITKSLSRQFESNVTLGSFDVSVQHGFDITGKDLRIQPIALPEYPPVIALQSFRCHVAWHDVIRLTPHIGVVHVQGLEINFPPKDVRNQLPHKKGRFHNTRFYIDRIECDDANLHLLTNKPGKVPLVFQIHSLVLTGVAPDRPMHYSAQLVNPKPIGDIDSTGTVGPWNAVYPRALPVAGHYSFQNADLGMFKGIAGILSSVGEFKGTLDNIECDGITDTPDFRLTGSNHPVDLKTQFHAIVDGTSGDTYLQPVHAQFLHSSFVAYGEVVRVPAVQGHRVLLNVQMDQGKLEDLLQLAVKTEPPLVTGDVHLTTKFDLEPGKENVLNRITLQGNFQTTKVHFNNPQTQEKIDDLSLRAQGRAKEAKLPNNPDVSSQLGGSFTLKKSMLTLQPLQYQAPGLQVNLNGTYSLDGRQLDLQGHALLQAKVSQTMTGMKSLLLKPLDPLFHKNGAGTDVPIKITGTQSSPKFGLNLKK
jgi:hypothetical protein